MKFVAVTWHDAWIDESDFSKAMHKPLTLVTVGILVKRNRRGVTLAMERGGPRDYRTQQFIPAGMVVKVREIK